MERIPILIDNHKRQIEKAAKDIPVFQEVVNNHWRKEVELRKLKSDLSALPRKIQMTIGENSTDTNGQNSNGSSQNLHVSPEKNMVEVAEIKAQFRV